MYQHTKKTRTITMIVLLFFTFLFGVFLFSHNSSNIFIAEAYTSNINGREELFAARTILSTRKKSGGGQNEGIDFLAKGTSENPTFSSNNIVFKGGFIVAKIPIETSTSDAGILSAMTSEYMRVSLMYSANVKAIDLAGGTYYRSYIGLSRNDINVADNDLSFIKQSIELVSATNNFADTDFQRPIGGGDTSTFTSSVGNDIGKVLNSDFPYYSNDDLFSIRGNTGAITPCVVLIIETSNTNMKIEVSNLILTVDVSFGSNELALSSDTELRISGVNRQTLIFNPMEDSSQLKDSFVKSGDKIRIKFGIVKQDGTRYNINDFHNHFNNFNKVFNSPYLTKDILWRYFVRHSDLPSERNTVLNEIDRSKEGEYGVIEFSVASAGILGVQGNQNKIHIMPRIFSSRINNVLSYFNYFPDNDFDSFYSNPSNTIWSIPIDNTKPNLPVIDTLSDFGKKIESQEWYTKDNNVPINLIEGSYNENTYIENNLEGKERLYGLILPSNISNISLNTIDFSLQTPTYIAGGIQYNVSTIGTLDRYGNDFNKLFLQFDGGQVNTLVLISVDFAGNVSSPSVYSASQGNAVRVDAESRQMSLFPYIANEMMPTENFENRFGESYFYKDDPSLYVDYDSGILKDSLPTGGSLVQSGTSASFKRDSKVVIRFSMKEEHRKNYILVRYNNVNNSPGITSTHAVGKEVEIAAAKKIIHYDMIYTIQDADWNVHNGLDINLHFGEFVNIRHNNTKYTFKLGYSDYGVEQDINNDFDVYSKIDNNLQITPKPDMQTEYFNAIKYSIKVYKEVEGIPGRRAVVTLDSDASNPIEISTTSLIPMKNKGYTLNLTYNNKPLKLTTLENVLNAVDITSDYESYVITAIELDNPQESPFANAGEYGYRISVKTQENSRYYGSNIGSYKIEKAASQVNQLEQMGVLYFGDSLDSLKLQSKNNFGQTILHDNATRIGDALYHASFIRGLYGTYTVISPSSSDDNNHEYILPTSSSNLAIRVEYQPIDLLSFDKATIENYFSFFQNYFDIFTNEQGETEYVIKPGTLHAGNYNKIELNITITVLPKQAIIYVEGGSQGENIQRIYNSEPQNVFFAAEDEFGQLAEFNPDIADPVARKKSVVFLVRYKLSGGTWTTVAPTNAGVYDVEARIDSSRCNYTSSILTIYLEINKKQLNVEVDIELTGNEYTSVIKYQEAFEFGLAGVTGVYEIDYMYLHLHKPILSSFHPDIEDGEDGEEFIENYLFSIYSVSTAQWQYLDLKNRVVGDLDVGEYIFKAVVDNVNYSGSEHIKIIVRTPTGDSIITEPFISLLENYETYALDGTHLGRTGHIEFGQILSESLNILDITNMGQLMFRPSTGADIIVQGRFYFESEEEYYDRNPHITKVYSPLNPEQLVLPVLYEGQNPRAHKVRLKWEAGEYENDVFIKNNNYEIFSYEVDLNVVRALLDFEDVTLAEIEYGQPFNSTTINGQVKSNNYLLDTIFYELSLINESLEGSIFDGGDHNVGYRFDFKSEFSNLYKNYYFEGTANIPLRVIPRQVTIQLELFNIVEGDLDDYSSDDALEENKGIIYNYSHENNPTEDNVIIAESTSGLTLENIRLDYTYYRVGLPGEEPNSSIGEFIDLLYPDWIRIPRVDRTTKPGRYIAIVSVSRLERNYVGTVQAKCFVIKSELELEQSLPNLEYGYFTNDLNYLLEHTTLNNGNQGNRIDFHGDLSFVDNVQLNEIGEISLSVTFEPSDNVSIYQYFKPFVKSITFNVIKRKVSFEYDTEDFIYTYNGLQQKPTVKIKHPITGEYIGQEDIRNILNIKYLSSGNIIPSIVDAGLYTIEISIKDDIVNEFASVLQGMESKSITVKKAQIFFSDVDIEYQYNGEIQSPIPVYTSDFANIENIADELRFEKHFINFTGNEVNPLRVGKYNMYIEVIHKNFEGTQNLVFYITPNIKRFNNLAQVYANPNGNDRLLDVEIEFNSVVVDGLEAPHQAVAYAVEYMYQSETIWTSLRPNGNAGTYRVRINFNQDGFNRTITTDLLGNPLRLIVEKREIDFTNYNIENQLKTFYYNGENISVRFLLGEFSANATYQFKEYEEDRPFEDLEGYENFVKDAGVYVTKISITGSSNYSGIYYTLITVRKANLTIAGPPTFVANSKIPFGSTISYINSIIEQGTGTVKWQKHGTAEEAVIFNNDNGTWKVLTDVSRYNAGNYRIDLTFELNEENQRNFNNPLSKLSIFIVKKDISAHLSFVESSLTKSYQAKELRAVASLNRTDAEIPDEYPEIKLLISYKKDTATVYSQAFPKEVGNYDLKVKIEDDNYDGEYDSNKKFEIKKALPKFLLVPKFERDIGISESFTNNIAGINYQDFLTDGIAIIEGTQTQIPGIFKIHDDMLDTVFHNANDNRVLLHFIPNEPDYYIDDTVYTTIFVTGYQINSSSIDFEIVYNGNNQSAIYGEPLSNFEIQYILVQNDSMQEKPGTFTWVDSSIIPNHGEFVDYIFTPDDLTYNIYKGKTTIPIQRGSLEYDENKSYLRVHENQTILDAIENKQYYFHITDTFSNLIVNDYNVNYKENSVSQEDLARIVTQDDIAKAFVRCGLIISNNNYESKEISIQSWAIIKIPNVNISLNKSTKFYDGEPIAIKTHINVNNTSYKISDNNIVIKKILNSKQKEVDKTQTNLVDTYYFYIDIDERVYDDGQILGHGKYYGSAILKFVVEKRNVTGELNIVNNIVSFIDNTLNVKFKIGDTAISNEFLSIEYFRSGVGGTVSIGSMQPRLIGEYYVKVKVLQNHPSYYSTEKQFIYKVEETTLLITFDRIEYQVDFGHHYSILPSFHYMLNGVSVPVSLVENQGYRISYTYRDNINQFIDNPVNAGLYRATVTVIGDYGYKGSKSVDLRINKAKTHIETVPFAPKTPIKYGDSLHSDVVLEGGRAVETIGQMPIDGKFLLSDLTIGDKPDAGEYNQVRVVFYPVSPNYDISYSTMNITILPREIDFKFSNLSVYYLGKAIWPTYTTVLEEEIEVEMSAKTANGIVVEAPMSVGIYYITIKANHNNYSGEKQEAFTIKAGKIVCVESPSTTTIKYGDKLQSSSIVDGRFKNLNNMMSSYVSGSIAYKYPNLAMITGVGVYSVDYVFTPSDINYEKFEGSVDVEVVQKRLNFVVENTTFIYGNTITSPRFIFLEGENAIVNNSQFEEELNSGAIRDVGSYGSYVAVIDEPNYTGEVTYIINILKRQVALDYYMVDKLDSKLVNRYETQYGQTLNRTIKVNQSSLAIFDIDKADIISKGIEVEYGYINSNTRFIDAPTDVGEYMIYPRMENSSNYTLKANEGIHLDIVKATVIIRFENLSLTNNVYGSTILPPNIITSPVSSNVKVRITFPGYPGEMVPQNAGTHAVKAEIIDRNYNPDQVESLFIIKRKALAITNIIAYDKAYNGLDNIAVKGTLEGVEDNDEVFLSMKARTEDGRFNVGVHKIVITDYSISGLAASNYYVNKPSAANIEVNIKKEIIHDHNSESYAKNLSGFEPNVSVSFIDIDDTSNKTNKFTKLIGQTAIVKRIVVMKNGIETTVDSPVKFYIKIPSDMMASKDLKVEFKGNLAGQNIQVQREDNYITFHANSSGEVLIYSNEFPYWIIVIAGAILMLISGIVAILVVYPARKRKRVSSEVQRAHEFGMQEEDNRIRASKRAEKAEIERKRNWRK